MADSIFASWLREQALWTDVRVAFVGHWIEKPGSYLQGN